MAIRKETIGQQLKRIQRLRLRFDATTGMMYNKPTDLTRRRRAITMIGLFVSDENTFLVRPHLFESKKSGRNAREWDAWLAEHYGKILRESILPFMEVRTGKQWRLYRIVGWVGNDNTRSIRAKIHQKRDKKK